MRAVIYARISKDRTGEELGVERQRLLCEKRAADLGWPVVEVLVDNDLSASGKKRRPSYERLLEGLRGKQYDAVVTYAVDRLTRSPRELEDLIDAIETANADMNVIMSGHIDLSTPLGRAGARIFGAIARAESEVKVQRQLDKEKEMARRGKAHAGGRRPYGYEKDRRSLREDEADVIRTVVRRLIEGVPIGRTLRELGYPRRADIDGRTGEVTTMRVRASVVSASLRNPLLIGYRMHHGVMHKSDEIPALLTLGEWNDVQRLYGGRAVDTADGRTIFVSEKEAGKKASVYRHLLTGLMTCGTCERPVRHDAGTRYTCTEGRCVSVDAKHAESTIASLALMLRRSIEVLGGMARDMPGEEEHLRRMAGGVEFGGGGDVTEAIAGVRARLDRLTDLYVSGDLERDDYEARRVPLRGELARLELEQSRAGSLPLTVPKNGWGMADLSDWWEAAALEERRKLVASVVTGVRVLSDGDARALVKKRIGDDEYRALTDKRAAVQAARLVITTYLSGDVGRG